MLPLPLDNDLELSLARMQFKIDAASGEPVWTPARQDLWQRIERHDFELDTPLNFTRRLARDHGWSLENTPRGRRSLPPLLLSRRHLANAGHAERDRRRSLAPASRLFTRLLDDLVRKYPAGSALQREEAKKHEVEVNDDPRNPTLPLAYASDRRPEHVSTSPR